MRFYPSGNPLASSPAHLYSAFARALWVRLYFSTMLMIESLPVAGPRLLIDGVVAVQPVRIAADEQRGVCQRI